MQDSTISQSSPQPSPHDRPTESYKRRAREGWRSVLSTIFVLGGAVLVALTLITFVFQSYVVDGPSMQNTLFHQDRLIVVKIQRTLARLTKKPYIPPRGTIIVFTKKGDIDYSNNEQKQLIKRVIGLPGERVVVKGGVVTIYTTDRPAGYNPDISGEYPRISISTPGTVDIVVPNGELFVLGDNRVNSLDSPDFGTVSADEVVGKLVFRIFPLTAAQHFN